MAEDSFKGIIFAFVLMSLFGLTILMAVSEVGTNYGMNTSEVVGGSLSIDKINTSISGLEQTSKNLQATFKEQDIGSSVVGVVVEGFFGISIDIFNLILTPFDVLANIMTDVLHVPYFISMIILGLLILSIMFAIFRLMKIGD